MQVSATEKGSLGHHRPRKLKSIRPFGHLTLAAFCVMIVGSFPKPMYHMYETMSQNNAAIMTW